MTGALCGTSYSGLTYEAHITIEPVENERLLLFEQLVKPYGFKVADLIMVKQRKITEERSNRDSFCTGWSNDLEELRINLYRLLLNLKDSDFKVWRYKIEQTIEDYRY